MCAQRVAHNEESETLASSIPLQSLRNAVPRALILIKVAPVRPKALF